MNDRIVAMDIDKPKDVGYNYRVVKPSNSFNPEDGERLYVVSVSGGTSDDGKVIQLWLVNNRPSIDHLSGEFLDQAAVGGNATIEVFETGPNASSMKHIRTFAHPQITTPNNVAVAKEGGFFFTNDHGPHKTGLV